MTFRQSSRGFTLIEIALVVVIASILLMAGIRVMIARAESAQLEVTRKNQEAIKTALISYLGKVRRLPCPDTDPVPDGRENRDVPANPPPCNAYVGTVPYLDLGLDRSAALDGWENYIAYVISPVNSTPPPPVVVPAWTTAWLQSYNTTTNDTLLTTNGTLSFWPTVSTGAVLVRNTVGGAALSDPSTNPPAGAVVVLISYGRNGLGAKNVTGATNDTTGAGTDELRNISPVVAAGPPVQIEIVNRDITDQVGANGSFDDIVLPLRQNDMVAPLVAGGTFLSSPVQAINQANDYVMGQIAASRFACPGPNPCNTCVGFYYTVPGTMALPSSSQVSYATVPPNTATCIASNSVGTSTAYTLTNPDSNARTVTNAEAIGILGRLGGFN